MSIKYFIFTFILFSIISCGENSIDTNKCSNTSCESWERCNVATGFCELQNNMCNSTDDCLAGYSCEENKCIEENECFTNEDCTDETKPICKNGICASELINKCENVNCESWERCNVATGFCELQNNMCNSTDDCLTGYSCDSNECKMINECRIDDDCDDNYLCSMGVCIEDPDFVSSCVENSDCWENTIKRSCVDLKCAVDNCTDTGYECAYNTNNRFVCNAESNKCEEPEIDLKGAVKDMVFNILSKLKWTNYTNSSYIYDVNAGALFLDCSFYVKQVIRRVSRGHYSVLPKSSSSGNTALAEDYYNFFNDLKNGSITSDLWEIVPTISNARSGDIIAYSYGSGHNGDTTGHVMIIMSTPQWSTCEDNLQHWVWVSDSANSGHKDDTRNEEGIYKETYDYNSIGGSGVGIGKMFFNTGSNPYYRWSSCSGNKNNIPILIGRMVLPE